MALINESEPVFDAKRESDPNWSSYSWYGLMSQNFTEQLGSTTKRIQVDKATHRIRYENESESQVTLVIEPKEQD